MNLLLHFTYFFPIVRETWLNFKPFRVRRCLLIKRDLLTWAWSAVPWRRNFRWHVILCGKINEAMLLFGFTSPIDSFIAYLSQSCSLLSVFNAIISNIIKVFHGMHALPKSFRRETFVNGSLSGIWETDLFWVKLLYWKTNI